MVSFASFFCFNGALVLKCQFKSLELYPKQNIITSIKGGREAPTPFFLVKEYVDIIIIEILTFKNCESFTS